MMANRQDQSNNQLADDPDIMTDPHKQGRELLQYCQDTYEYLWQRFLEFHRRAEPEQVLAGVEGMARFAWMHHPGKFADSVLEQFALEIGTQLELLVIHSIYACLTAFSLSVPIALLICLWRRQRILLQQISNLRILKYSATIGHQLP